jgi:hypothetical protein
MKFRAWSDEEIERRLSLEENFKPLTDGVAHFIVDDAEEMLEPRNSMIFSPDPLKMVLKFRLFVWNDEGGSGVKTFYTNVQSAASHKFFKEFLSSIGAGCIYEKSPAGSIVEINPRDFIGESSTCIIKLITEGLNLQFTETMPTENYFLIEKFLSGDNK